MWKSSSQALVGILIGPPSGSLAKRGKQAKNSTLFRGILNVRSLLRAGSRCEAKGEEKNECICSKLHFSTEIQIYRVVFKCEVGTEVGAEGVVVGSSVCRKHHWETWNVTARIKS